MTLLKNARQNAIINETKELFLEKGIEGVTMAEIASHLSIGEASLYRYFGKKQNLIIKVAILIWQEVYQKFKDRPVKSTGYENLEVFYASFLEVFEKHPSFYRFVEEFDLKVVQEGISSEDLKEYEQVVLEFKEIFYGFFHMGERDGTVKDIVDKDIFYYSTNHALLSLCKKLATQPQLLKYEHRIQERAQIEYLIKVCLEYIKK